jgi:hypothetical protein
MPNFVHMGEALDGTFSMWMREEDLDRPRHYAASGNRSSPTPVAEAPRLTAAGNPVLTPFEQIRKELRDPTTGELAQLAGTLGLPPECLERDWFVVDHPLLGYAWALPEKDTSTATRHRFLHAPIPGRTETVQRERGSPGRRGVA